MCVPLSSFLWQKKKIQNETKNHEDPKPGPDKENPILKESNTTTLVVEQDKQKIRLSDFHCNVRPLICTREKSTELFFF